MMSVDKNQKVYIYGLVDPLTEMVRYIGKALNYNDRFKNHIADAKRVPPRNLKVTLWIRDLLTVGLTPKIIVLEITDLVHWQEREIHWISSHKRKWKLLNVHKGGTGIEHTPKTKKKRSSIYKKLWATPEYREKIMRARENMYTPELRNKIGENSRKNWANPKTKSKLIKTMREVMADPSIRSRISESMKKIRAAQRLLPASNTTLL